MALAEASDQISISDADKLGVSALVRQAASGREQIVLRGNKPVAAVMSFKRLEQFQQLQDDMVDLSLATARMLTTGPQRHTSTTSSPGLATLENSFETCLSRCRVLSRPR